MKKLLVVALVVAGCSSQTPQEPPLPDGMVTLATFTADVDLAAGTIAIRAKPTEAGTRAGFGSLAVDGDVDLTNDSVWINSTTDHGCGTEAPFPATWGAEVRITSLLSNPTSLGGVYAEIYDIGGGTGNTSCNMVAAPTGFIGTYGLWSYGTIRPGESATTPWTFNYVSATSFTFYGRIVAAKVDTLTLLPTVYPGEQTIGDNGANIVYASDEDPWLQFVNYNGTNGGHSILLPAYATAIAPDPTDGLIWLTTEPDTSGDELVGYLPSAGTAEVLADGGSGLGGIAPDPAVANRAWYRSEAGGYIRSIVVGTPTPELGTPIDTPFVPHGLAFGPGPGAKLFVTSPADNQIMRFSGAGVFEDSFETPPGCLGPTAIILGPDGQLWFTAVTSNAVCRMTVAGAFTPVAIDVTGPGQIVSDGTNVWVTGSALNEVVRVDTAGPGYQILLPEGAGASGLTFGGSFLWAVNVNNGLIRIQR